MKKILWLTICMASWALLAGGAWGDIRYGFIAAGVFFQDSV